MATAEFVTIACKAPNGLILDLDYIEIQNAEKGTIRTHRTPREKCVTLKGWARRWGDPDTTEGGYALTQVPKDFWDAWIARNSESSLITDKIILPPHRDARAQAVDHREVEQMFRPAREGDVKGVKADKAA